MLTSISSTIPNTKTLTFTLKFMTNTYIKSPEYKSVTEILREEYNEFLANFDPSPQNYGDDYSTPPDFETWVIDQEEESE